LWKSSQKESMVGDFLALFSALTYAVYVTWFKKSSRGSEHNIDAAVFLGRNISQL
jgi:hypothetical protein